MIQVAPRSRQTRGLAPKAKPQSVRGTVSAYVPKPSAHDCNVQCAPLQISQLQAITMNHMTYMYRYANLVLSSENTMRYFQ